MSGLTIAEMRMGGHNTAAHALMSVPTCTVNKSGVLPWGELPHAGQLTLSIHPRKGQ